MALLHGFLKINPIWRRCLIWAWHVIGICFTYWLAYLLRFDARIPPAHSQTMLRTLPILLVCCLLSFVAFRLYSGLWSYFSYSDVPRLAAALCVAVGSFAFCVFALNHWSFQGFSRSVLIIEFLLLLGWMGGGRLAARFLRQQAEQKGLTDMESVERLLVVGTIGDVDLVLRSARNHDLGAIVGVVSTESADHRCELHGVKVYHCNTAEIGRIVATTDATTILALPPFNRPQELDLIVDSCVNADVRCGFRTIPSLAELASGKLTVSLIRDVNIEDLLDRGEVQLARAEVIPMLAGKHVMVTGAGGSIGTELCRQIASYGPSCLVLYEISEYGLYTVERMLRKDFPTIKIISFAGDIRHSEELHAAIDAAKGIDILYHAAAYKHVPLMEANAGACLRNNVLGTAALAEVAEERNIPRVVMISSDKAVRPCNIMGASKRLAERVVMERRGSPTCFVSVRFGNVLNSSGSVVPLFREQIAQGGPVTVTNPEVRRFFMTIPEAVDLVLAAGAIGDADEIMVLEMGEPVRINRLAERLIELSGYVPHHDIKIVYTGLRPGEKEYEEVMTDDENVVHTSHEKIWILRQDRKPPTQPLDLDRIRTLVNQNDQDGIREFVKEAIPEHSFETTDSPPCACQGGKVDKPPQASVIMPVE